MGFFQAVRCDGCGTQGATTGGGSLVTLPEGWQARNVGSTGMLGQLSSRVITVCPECWASKPLAEVLRA